MEHSSTPKHGVRFSHQDADHLRAQIRDLSRTHRALRKCWARLLYDLLAIASKVRPAVLLDYVGSMTRESLEQIVCCINSRRRHWCVMFHEDAWFVLNPGELCGKLAVKNDRALVVCAKGHGCNLIDEKDSKEFLDLRERVLWFVQSSFVGGDYFADFPAPEGNLSMVTLTGLLLDYPIIYNIDKIELPSARGAFVGCSLDIVNIELDSSIVQSHCQLLCFSVPKVIVSRESKVNNLIESLVSRLKSSAKEHQDLWGDTRTNVSLAPGHSITL